MKIMQMSKLYDDTKKEFDDNCLAFKLADIIIQKAGSTFDIILPDERMNFRAVSEDTTIPVDSGTYIKVSIQPKLYSTKGKIAGIKLAEKLNHDLFIEMGKTKKCVQGELSLKTITRAMKEIRFDDYEPSAIILKSNGNITNKAQSIGRIFGMDIYEADINEKAILLDSNEASVIVQRMPLTVKENEVRARWGVKVIRPDAICVIK